MSNCWVECSTNPKSSKPFFRKSKFKFFKIKLPNNCAGWSKTKKPPRNICKRTLDKGFERDWSPGLGAMLGDGHTEN